MVPSRVQSKAGIKTLSYQWNLVVVWKMKPREKKLKLSLSCLYCSQLLLRKGLIKEKATLLAAATTVKT